MKFLFFILASGAFFSSMAQPPQFGVSFRELEKGKEAALAPCPSTPNCVTSFVHPGQRPNQTVSPLKGNNVRDSLAKIKKFALENGGIVTQETNNYLRILFTSKYLKLSDNTEFYFPNPKVIHFRSASAKNLYTDFGANLRRIKRIEEQL